MTLDEVKKAFHHTHEMDQLIICDKGTAHEHYIDPRTKTDTNFNYLVYPITENSFQFAFVCPNCQRIHRMEKRKNLEFPVSENELPPEQILETKEYIGENCMIKIVDPHGMTVMKPYVYNLVSELGEIVSKTHNSNLMASYSALFDVADSEAWDNDTKEI